MESYNPRCIFDLHMTSHRNSTPFTHSDFWNFKQLAWSCRNQGLQQIKLVLPPATKLQQCFCTCLSFCSQGGSATHPGQAPQWANTPPPWADTPPGRHPLSQTPPWADTPCPMHAGIHTPCPVHAGMQSTSEQYTSYWNAFLLPPTNEVWGKVIFLHLFVILFTGGLRGCRGACVVAGVCAWLPGDMHGCRGQAWLPGGMGGCWGGMHGCRGMHGCWVVCGCWGGLLRIWWDTVNKRAVCILLECILVIRLFLQEDEVNFKSCDILQTNTPEVMLTF